MCCTPSVCLSVRLSRASDFLEIESRIEYTET